MTKIRRTNPLFKRQQLNIPSSELLKIISFPPYYPPHLGGLETSAADLDHQFAINGHQITVFTSDIAPSNSGYRDSNLTNIVRYPALDIIFGYPIPKLWSRKFWRLFKPLIKTRHDVVISTTRFFLSSFMALVYARVTRTPLLHIEHGSDYVKSDNFFVSLCARIYDETLGRVVLKFSSINVAPSMSAKIFVSKFDKRSCPVIYRGIYKEKIDAIKPDMALRNLHPNKIIITFAGRFIDGKGIPDLLRSLSKLPNEKYIALLIGSGPLEKSMSDLAKKLKLSDQVYFLGQRAHKEAIAKILASDIFVNPSYNEGLPTVLLEAGLAGCAIVATDVGGTSEIITHNESGMLYAPKNIATLTKYLLELMGNPKLREELAQEAKQAVTEKFSWEKAYRHYMTTINKIK